VFETLWRRRIPQNECKLIHGLLFYEYDHKKIFYPTRRDGMTTIRQGSNGCTRENGASPAAFSAPLLIGRWPERRATSPRKGLAMTADPN
jgi:hypothetical protein